MKKFALSLAALIFLSASALTASAQSSAGPDTVGGTIPRPQTVGGTIPRPQGLFGGLYAAVMQYFGF